ncbi:MAG TPA: YHS domain-containing protein [Planctomycetota bacterium]|nr:YHS domain-containing protein [Planctomycetota bacterium]
MKSLISLAALGLLATGCTSSPQQGGADHSWNADFGKWGKDPVAGKVILRQTALKREYQGVTYYFQNEAEAKEFESNPAAYVTPPQSAAPAENSGEVQHQSSVHSR